MGDMRFRNVCYRVALKGKIHSSIVTLMSQPFPGFFMNELGYKVRTWIRWQNISCKHFEQQYGKRFEEGGGVDFTAKLNLGI